MVYDRRREDVELVTEEVLVRVSPKEGKKGDLREENEEAEMRREKGSAPGKGKE